MGYRGKVVEQARAAALRGEGWTVPEIAAELGVSRSSVSLWVRDVPYVPRRGRPPRTTPNALQRQKAAEIERLAAEGRARIGELTERDLLIAGTALYAGEGFKTRQVGMANTDPRILHLFVTWLRTFFEIDESRLKIALYLHAELDLERAASFWSDLLHIPADRFLKPYRAAPDPTRRAPHPMGCPRVTYTCSRTHRAVMGLVDALLPSSLALPG